MCGDKPEPSFSIWAHDSLKLARDTAYRNGPLKGAYHTTGDYAPDTPALPADYEAAAKQVAAKQIMLAGYRLADVVNGTFGKQSAPVVPARQ